MLRSDDGHALSVVPIGVHVCDVHALALLHDDGVAAALLDAQALDEDVLAQGVGGLVVQADPRPREAEGDAHPPLPSDVLGRVLVCSGIIDESRGGQRRKQLIRN